MPGVYKSVLVEHPAMRMFELVDHIENYPQFLPWCGGSQVHQRDTTTTVASIDIHFLGVKSRFSTENHKQITTSPLTITMALKDGPFRSLSGTWRFTALGESACKVEFTLKYEFSNKALALLIGPMFSKIASTFIDEFVAEANKTAGKVNADSHLPDS